MEREQAKANVGDVAILLTAEEADALETAIRECTTNTGASYVTALKVIEHKLHEAKGKML